MVRSTHQFIIYRQNEINRLSKGSYSSIKQIGIFGLKYFIFPSLIWLSLFERRPIYKRMSFHFLSNSIDYLKITAIAFVLEKANSRNKVS